jgi:hypothetical protein
MHEGWMRLDGIASLLNSLFADVCEHLNADSLNYHVDIKLYRSHGTAGTSVSEIVKCALGDRPVLGGTYAASAKEIVDEVILSLRYGEARRVSSCRFQF